MPEPVEFWEPHIENISRKELMKLQFKRLKRQLIRVYEYSPFYRRRFREAGVTPDDLRSLDDLRKFPFTTKDDLRNYAYPNGGEFLTVLQDQLISFHMTSGTTGRPTVGPYTANDLELWTNLMARSLVAAGVRKGDVMLNAYGYGLFTGGLGFHYGAMRIGAAVIPWSAGRTEGLVQALLDYKATVLSSTPSYMLYIAEVMEKKGVDPRQLSLRITCPGAEPVPKELVTKINNLFALKERNGGTRQCYGSTELIGPGAGMATPCIEDLGGFLMWTDHFYVEVIDPDTGEPVGEGEEGELVITHLTREAMPLIRYRHRDIVKVSYVSTDCGREAFPVVQIRGRVDDVIFYKGTKIFPTAIQEILAKIPEVLEYQIVIDRRGPEHHFILKIETPFPSDALAQRIANEVQIATFARPKVEFVPPNTLPRFEGKAKRVVILE